MPVSNLSAHSHKLCSLLSSSVILLVRSLSAAPICVLNTSTLPMLCRTCCRFQLSSMCLCRTCLCRPCRLSGEVCRTDLCKWKRNTMRTGCVCYHLSSCRHLRQFAGVHHSCSLCYAAGQRWSSDPDHPALGLKRMLPEGVRWQ